MDKIFINTDGGSRGNPGPAAIGVVFRDQNGEIIHKYKKCIGVATNNEAEYGAIICALEILQKSDWISKNGDGNGEIICRLDSQLVVEQINGNYKIKKDHIRVFVDKIHRLILELPAKITFDHIPREENKDADELVNIALDLEKK